MTTITDLKKVGNLWKFFNAVFFTGAAWALGHRHTVESSHIFEASIYGEAALLVLSVLHVNKSMGPENVTARVFFEVKHEKTKPISIIFLFFWVSAKTTTHWEKMSRIQLSQIKDTNITQVTTGACVYLLSVAISWKHPS